MSYRQYRPPPDWPEEMNRTYPALKTILVTITFFAIPAFITACDKSPTGPDSDDLKILFIGSSYLAGWDLIDMFHDLAKEAGKEVWIGEEVISGKYLEYHAISPHTERKINNREWDYIIMQGGCTTVAYPETQHQVIPPYVRHDAYGALDLLQRKIWANHAGTRPVFMMPWAFEDGLLWIDGQDDTRADMQLLIYENTLAWADSFDLSIAPVGWAFHTVIEARPFLHYLHVEDYNHAEKRGAYLAACVFFVTVFQESVAGNALLPAGGQ